MFIKFIFAWRKDGFSTINFYNLTSFLSGYYSRMPQLHPLFLFLPSALLSQRLWAFSSYVFPCTSHNCLIIRSCTLSNTFLLPSVHVLHAATANLSKFKRTLRESFGYKSLIDLFHRAKNKFDSSLLTHHNPIISHLARNLVMEQE